MKGEFEFTFVDLFAGIGGFRLGLEKIGGKCVFSCEIDKYARKTYAAWFGEDPDCDIRKVDPNSIQDHDILTGGYPCPSFSIAGVSQRNAAGKKHGYEDPVVGNLFFEVIRIAEIKKPKVLFLENVKNFASHNKGNTLKIAINCIEELGYKAFYKIIDGSYCVPQHRERIFIVGLNKDYFGNEIQFKFPVLKDRNIRLKDILETAPDAKYTLTDFQWDYHQKRKEKNRISGKGFGYGLCSLDGITRTLSARYYKDGSEIFIMQEGKNPRRLTPREAARLMGYPDRLPIVVSDTQAYKQFGNAVIPIVITDIGKQIKKALRKLQDA